jgi:uncharacterized protein with PIN domain
MEAKFLVDINAGKLARWLRLIGYDTLLFIDKDDGQMLKIAVEQDRIILTKDSQFMKRRLITSGRVKSLLISGEDSNDQLRQAVEVFHLDYQFRPFSICLECNCNLEKRTKEEIKDLVPPYVFKTQTSFMECPCCHRIYWQGTHWQSMENELEKFWVDKSLKSEAKS